MASKLQVRRALERSIGITPEALSKFVEGELESAFQFVEEEFNRVLDELKSDSISGTFEGYTVETHRDTQRYRLPKSGRTVTLPTQTVFIESPHADLNVFDILDTGRKGLPVRASGAYPLWSLRDPTETAPERRRAPSGRFAFTLPANRASGIRPASKRDSLRGSYPQNPEHRPIVWSKGPLAAVEPRNLYKRIQDNALKKLRNRSLRTLGIVRIPRE